MTRTGSGLAAALTCLIMSAAALPAAAQETLRLTMASGHPAILPWVKHLSETFIPAVDAELAKTGNFQIDWTEGYGGTIVKLGSETDAMEGGLMDVGNVAGIFDPAKLGMLNLTFQMPFGPDDPVLVARAAERALRETGALDLMADTAGVVYIGGGYASDPYNVGSTTAMRSLGNFGGAKIAGAGPNLGWIAAAGAVGVQSTLNTLYSDLQTGLVEGYVAPLTAAFPLRTYEVAPFWNEVGFGSMFLGGIGVSKMTWDGMDDEVKAAFETAAEAYAAAYAADQAAAFDAVRAEFAANGGEIVAVPDSDRSAWIAALRDPAGAWLQLAEMNGEPGRAVLDAYVAALAEAGFIFERDYLAE